MDIGLLIAAGALGGALFMKVVQRSPEPAPVPNPVPAVAQPVPEQTPPVQAAAPAPEPAPSEPLQLVPIGPDQPWHTEHDPTSTAAYELSAAAVQFRFRLGAGVAAGQFAAVASDVLTDDGIERINFTARASRPMRISVQVRLRNNPNGARWQRSIYVDETPRSISIAVRDLEKVEMSSMLRPIVARLHAVLFVVDTLNTLPGTDGTVWLTNLNLGIGKLD
jgi:hypothetical protein